MIPEFDYRGLLPPGVYWVQWDEMVGRFGSSRWRRQLLTGLSAALQNLKSAGCRTAYLDGSFVTAKAIPNDYDVCWDESGVDPEILDPVLLTFDAGRATQKAKYGGEFFPASHIANPEGFSFYDFFQTDKVTGERKGIIGINLEELQ